MRRKLIGTILALASAVAAGSAQAEVRVLGQARGWVTVSSFDRGQFTGCATAITPNGNRFGIASDPTGQWNLSFGIPGVVGPRNAGFRVDRQNFTGPAHGTGTDVVFGVGSSVLGALRAGNGVSISLPEGVASYSLAGSSAAISAVENCLARRGF